MQSEECTEYNNMSISSTAGKKITDHLLRFDDETDLAALGLHTEAHDWRLPANLPAKPKGLALSAPKPSATWTEQELPILQYQPDWRVWIVPVFAFSLMLSCLGLISFRLPIANSVLVVLSITMLTILCWSIYNLRQQRLVVDQGGILYSSTATAQAAAKIGWDDLVGISNQRCFAGRTLILMSRHGVDHSIRIAYLPAQKADQLTRLLRTQLARRTHV